MTNATSTFVDQNNGRSLAAFVEPLWTEIANTIWGNQRPSTASLSAVKEKVLRPLSTKPWCRRRLTMRGFFAGCCPLQGANQN